MPSKNPIVLKAKYKRRAEKDRARRIAMIVALGGRCSDCGETDLTKLHLDHIFGFKGTHRSTSEYEKQFRLHRLRVLCGSCNSADGARRTNYKKKMKSFLFEIESHSNKNFLK